MVQIHLLDNSLINKIAAGEVIERPSSVVKELVENSIDAGATSITIEIKDGGINLIKITDNGKGIPKEQVKTAFLRHATSKLYDFDDLENILTLGFRGEALSSIASVSQVEMITKTKDEDAGTKIEISGGNVIAESSVGAPEGTSFIMRNLFFNTPARRKFLKKPVTESGYVSDIIYKIALGHPHIAFKFINNSNVIFQTSGNNDLKTAVFHIYGKIISQKMIELDYSEKNYVLKGLIAKPEISRANRTYENFFINGRFIKSKIVQNAVEEAYKGKLMTGKFPVFVINMTVPKNSVDVNVHPSKLEVRFADDEFIFDMLYKAVKKALQSEMLIPNVEWDKDKTVFSDTQNNKPYIPEEKQDNVEMLLIEEECKSNDNYKPDFNYSYENTDNNSHLANVGEAAESELPAKKKYADIVNKIYTKPEKINSDNSDRVIQLNNDINIIKEEQQNKKSFFNNYKIIGQLFNTYWIIEQNNSMYMIDQHAAHERALYEELIQKIKNDAPVSQRLIQPIPVSLSPSEKNVVDENMELFKSFGFELEEFGVNTYALRSVPYIFNSPADAKFFIEIVDMLSEKSITNVYDTKLDAVATMSCKAAVKGNDKLNYIEAKALIEKIVKLENPFTCPHGRPTIIEMSRYELEKKFKRIQN